MKIQLQAVDDRRKKVWASSAIAFHEDWFDLTMQTPIENSGGRAAVKKIVVDGLSMIVRHYYRGGFPARLSKDRFVFSGWQSSRPCREIHLLQDMCAEGLPVPRPIAARCLLHGMFYSADIITQEITHAQTLTACLMQKSLDENLWGKVGATIKRFHRHGFEHVDLNANNILLDKSEDVYLIDFDRCQRRTYENKWALAGIDRLQRSLQKIQRNETKFNFSEENFLSLLQGYEA